MTKALKTPIGILGGTFDPIHVGHLRMAIELYEACRLAKVHLIPCYQPVHRPQPAATPVQRLAMVKAAVENEASLVADDREIVRQGLSYTIDTLLELQSEATHTPICILIGIDAFLGFDTWHRYQEILERAHLIIAYRPPYELPNSGPIKDILNKHLKDDVDYIHQHLAGGILLKPISLLEISASDIRKQIAEKKNPRYLLPMSVFEYMQQHHIYS